MDAEGVVVSPPLRVLLQAMLSAECFIHFTSIGVSPFILGALKLAAQKVPVRGIVSVVGDYLTKELTEFEDEAPRLEVRLFDYKMQPESRDTIPHQKIIVIDGLIAFKGSANLTVSGWRRAAEGRDIVETETDMRQVIELHNRFFSPIWAEFSDTRIIRLSGESPDSL
jgi:phosphatidylserine/phosphatidylglycerophosphate/cardiolipin synthase-like enzyme